jgi:DNA invertase Pin-like site-specific DNA recombinase
MPNCFSMIELKWQLLQDIIDKKRKQKEVVEILKVSRQTLWIRKKKYEEEGIEWLVPKKSWPKSWETHNKTEDWLENELMVIKYL